MFGNPRERAQRVSVVILLTERRDAGRERLGREDLPFFITHTLTEQRRVTRNIPTPAGTSRLRYAIAMRLRKKRGKPPIPPKIGEGSTEPIPNLDNEAEPLANL